MVTATNVSVQSAEKAYGLEVEPEKGTEVRVIPPKRRTL